MTTNSHSTPIVNILHTLSQKPHAAFYAPGHKRGQGISPHLAKLLGKSVFTADLPELPELDNLFAPEGVIKEAQDLAAIIFGAEKTWFLVNGSTCGIIATILATCNTGDKIILPRNCHSSAIAGLILSGAIPIFIHPEYNPIHDLTLSITPQALEATLKQHSDAKAVFLVYPTYQGICGDVGAIANLTHSYHIPLLVDEAHGAHFAFSPDFPPSALSMGADVTVQSTHKVLGAMSQASMLHLQGSRVSPEKIQKALQLVQSTSPSYLLLASLDAARQQMALEGQALMEKTLQLANSARNKIASLPNLSVLQPPLQQQPEFMWLDATRLTVFVHELGINGLEVDEILHEKLGVTAELPLFQHLTFILTFGNTSADIDKLTQAFTTLSQISPMGKHTGIAPTLPIIPYRATTRELPLQSLSPREAFFATTEMVSLEKAVGCISAELICPYPPGIPTLMPGEKITSVALDYLQQVLAFGGSITGCSDPTLQTLKIVKSPAP